MIFEVFSTYKSLLIHEFVPTRYVHVVVSKGLLFLMKTLSNKILIFDIASLAWSSQKERERKKEGAPRIFSKVFDLRWSAIIAFYPYSTLSNSCSTLTNLSQESQIRT